jgi:predicted O-methyltransferase YrrM
VSEAALSPQLLSFLARAVGARKALAIGADGADPHVGVLREAGVAVTTRTSTASDAPDDAPIDPAALPSELDLLYLAPGTRLPHPPGRALVVAADPASLPEPGYAGVASPGPDWTAIRVARGPAPDAPRFALAMAGRLPAAACTELATIVTSSRRERPTEPMPEDAGALLWLLMRARRTRRAWELGGGVGASTIWLAAGLRRPGGHLTVVERDTARHKLARGHLKRAGLADRVDLRMGVSGRLMRHLPGSPSLVLLDHDIFDRADDLMAILPRCAPGALIAAHGMYVDVSDHARFRALVVTQPEVAAETTLAVGQGLSLTLLKG